MLPSENLLSRETSPYLLQHAANPVHWRPWGHAALEEARALMRARGLEGETLERQARHRVFAGNRPSVTLIYDRLTPFRLGQILALYEHRVFVEGTVLGINSFDQWGVELGKELATALQPVLEGADAAGKDASTRQLVAFFRDVAG